MDSYHETCGADLRDQRAWKAAQRGCEVASQNTGILKQAVTLDDFQHFQSCRAGDWVSPVCGAMTSRAEQITEGTSFVDGSVRDPEGPEGETICYAFGPRDTVWLDVGGNLMPATPIPRATETTLHLIKKKKHAVFVTKRPQATQEVP